MLQSICWHCARSWRDKTLHCSWHKGLVLPDGAEAITKPLQKSSAGQDVRCVVSCPLFMKIQREEGKECIPNVKTVPKNA